MFEIGPALREARERRGLSYSQVEAETAIRSRYVRALEEEEFSILPGPVYTKGFLRAYAEYLNLDGQLFVDEFNSRHHDPRREFDQPIASQPRSRPQQRRHRRESQLVLIALAAIVAVTSIIFLVGLKGSPNVATITPPTSSNTTPTTGSTGSTGSTGTTTTKTHKKKKSKPPANQNVTVVLTASGGGCWVSVHKASGGGVVTTSGQDLGAGYTIDPAISPTVTFVGKAPMTMQVGELRAASRSRSTARRRRFRTARRRSSVLKITSTGVSIA